MEYPLFYYDILIERKKFRRFHHILYSGNCFVHAFSENINIHKILYDPFLKKYFLHELFRHIHIYKSKWLYIFHFYKFLWYHVLLLSIFQIFDLLNLLHALIILIVVFTNKYNKDYLNVKLFCDYSSSSSSVFGGIPPRMV